MLNQALKEPSPNVAYMVGAAENIPYGDELFDAVTCFSAFHWFQAEGALSEICRVLKPCGAIAITNKNEIGDFKSGYRDVIARFIDRELPDAKRNYDPLRQLHTHRFYDIRCHTIDTSEWFSLGEAIAYCQTVSLWNLVPNVKREAALAATEDFCRARVHNGRVRRDLVVRTVIGKKPIGQLS